MPESGRRGDQDQHHQDTDHDAGNGQAATTATMAAHADQCGNGQDEAHRRKQECEDESRDREAIYLVVPVLAETHGVDRRSLKHDRSLHGHIFNGDQGLAAR